MPSPSLLIRHPQDLHVLPTGILRLAQEDVKGLGLPTRVAKAFQESSAAGLISLAADVSGDELLPPAIKYWQGFTREFLTVLCQQVGDIRGPTPPPPAGELLGWAAKAPPAPGSEYVNVELLADLWARIDEHVAQHAGSVESWLRAVHPLWRMVGRVTFHLAENKRSDLYPFAFLATYTHRVSAGGTLQYLPLGRALKQYAGAKNTRALKSLLEPVQAAAKSSEFAAELLDSKRVFGALAWTAPEALRFIRGAQAFEAAGIVVKVPDWWKKGRPSKVQVDLTVGEEKQVKVGIDSLVSFKASLALDGETITEAEWEKILAAPDNLVRLKGQWVEVDREKLTEMLEHWDRAAGTGLTLNEAMRMLAGFREVGGEGILDGAPEGGGDWLSVSAGGRLKSLLDELRCPGEREPPKALKATLRPYQKAGYQWLSLLSGLGLGACLADDMGLGKTIQVIALLTAARSKKRPPSLLVVPASLVGNWKAEFEKFAPTLKIFYAHPSQTDRGLLKDVAKSSQDHHAVVTTYSMLGRLAGVDDLTWDHLVLDEAQAIKNPRTAQTRRVKAIQARAKVALTGTPVENSAADLWSLFDFLNPGLLGTSSQFAQVLKRDDAYGKVRELVSPYILRRLKVDKSVIGDLPDKVELRTDCALTKGQAAMYRKSVESLKKELARDDLEGFERAGLVLMYLMRFKQICNHPALWTGSGNFTPKDSGKFRRLGAIASEIAARGEKLLVFTQFREMTAPISEFLSESFGRGGLVLHGGTSVKRRPKLVDQFQSDTGPPFFVISLKAGGTGLNLTAASHVVHFDRWWNPAVEDQATDRAFRIGQQRNVLVHKFVCRGTIEEKIDAIIQDKRGLASELLESTGTEKLLTQMGNDELLDLVSLNIDKAVF